MGALLCGPSNTDDKNLSHALNLSDDCLERLLKEREGKKSAGWKTSSEELNLPDDLDEDQWMMKLKCLDEAHSKEFGITIENIYQLMAKIENTMGDLRRVVCPPDELMQCLKKNSNCSIKCKRQMDAFIDCVDTARINIIKEKVENEKKEKRKEERTVVEHFLKNKC